MKAALAVIASLLVLPAAAGTPQTASNDGNFHARLYERYCEKLRESPEAYVQFVRRLKPVHGYTYTDFAPNPGVAPRADCKVSPGRIAAVHRVLEGSKG